MSSYGNAIAYETKTVSNTAVGFTLGSYSDVGTDDLDATIVFLSVDGQAGTNDLRYTLDGTTPVAQTTGHLLQAGQTLTVYGHGNISKFRAIRDTSNDVKIHATYFL